MIRIFKTALLNLAAFVMISGVVISCNDSSRNPFEFDQVSEIQIQNDIINDPQFKEMMETVGEINKQTALLENQGTTDFTKIDEATNLNRQKVTNIFIALERKYPNFNNNAQIAVARQSSVTPNKVYDPAYVCNAPESSCDRTRLNDCWNGCTYSQSACLRNGNGSSVCNPIVVQCRQGCCDNYCGV